MSPAEREALARIVTTFEDYARQWLRILPKAGGDLVPLAFNSAQRHIHRAIETQRESIGRVRAIILKGRQQGASTYTEGRLLWSVATRMGVKAYVLAHEQAASDNLFRMVDRYYRHLPAFVRPALAASNAKELVFGALGSRIEVATAGTKGTGRSGTAQFLHGSEVAFWPHAAEHFSGIGQTVADAPDTEIILESTANGTANVFHEQWQAAVNRRSDYVPIFVPWFWQAEYTAPPAADWEASREDRDYGEAYGLTQGQLYWRRRKIDSDFRGDAGQFDREYPASPEVAFASSSPRALISAALVHAARKARGVEGVGPLILGVDPAEYGDDETSVMARRGRVAWKVDGWQGLGPMETVAKVGVIADQMQPDAIHIDATNSAGITDRLAELGYPVVRVHFGERARQEELYVTVRDEMWGDMLTWLQDKPASIPDDDGLAAQLTSVERSYDSSRRSRLEPKEKMKGRGLRSPDDADALALTMYRSAESVAGGGGYNAWRNRTRYG